MILSFLHYCLTIIIQKKTKILTQDNLNENWNPLLHYKKK